MCVGQVVNDVCFIFPHDGEEHYNLAAACVLDTNLMTLRVCGPELLQQVQLDQLAPNSSLHLHEGTSLHLQQHLEACTYHFEACNGSIACFPQTDRLDWLLHMAWTAHLPAATRSIPPPALPNLTTRPLSLTHDPLLSSLLAQSQTVAAASAAGRSHESFLSSSSSPLRFLVKVVEAVSVMVLLAHDGREVFDFSSITATHIARPCAPEAAAPDMHTTNLFVGVPEAQVNVLRRVVMTGSSEALEALQGKRCRVFVVRSSLVVIPQVHSHSLTMPSTPRHPPLSLSLSPPSLPLSLPLSLSSLSLFFALSLLSLSFSRTRTRLESI